MDDQLLLPVLLLLWVTVGLAATAVAINIFRKKGSKEHTELLLAAIGPFMGPVTAAVMGKNRATCCCCDQTLVLVGRDWMTEKKLSDLKKERQDAQSE